MFLELGDKTHPGKERFSFFILLGFLFCDLDSFNLHIQTKFLPIRQQKLWEMCKWRSRLQNSRFFSKSGSLGKTAGTYLNMQNADSFAVYENVQCEKRRLMLWLARNRLPKSCAFPGIGLSTAERQAPFVHALIEVNPSAFKIFFLY